MRKILLSFFLLFVFIGTSFAQEKEIIRGQVIGENEAPIRQAFIIVNTLNGEEPYVIEADTLGNYTIPFAPERFTLNISALGYQTNSFEVELKNYPQRQITSVLERSSFSLDEVMVIGEAPKIKRENGKFVMKDISLHPFSKGNNTFNFLKIIPILNVKNDGEISILNKENAVILVNGRSSGYSNPVDFLKTVPADQIEKIEIIPVTGSAYSASNKSGIINFILKRRADEGMKASLSIEDTQSHYNSIMPSLYLNYAYKKINITLGLNGSVHKLYSKNVGEYEYFENSLKTDTRTSSNYKTKSLSEYLNFDYHINKNQVLGFRLGSNQFNSKDYSKSFSTFRQFENSIDSTKLSNSFLKSPNSKNYSWNGNAYYSIKTDSIGSEFSVDVNYINALRSSDKFDVYTKYLPDNSSVKENDFKQRTKVKYNIASVSIKDKRVLSENDILTSGLSLIRGKTNNDYFYGIHDGTDYINDSRRSNKFDFKDLTLAGYVSYEKSWSDKFESEVGLRYEYYHANGEEKTTKENIKRIDKNFFPSISLSYDISDNHELSLDMSSSYFIPSYSMLNPFVTYNSATMYTKNNPNLRPSKGYEAMLSYSFFKKFMFFIDYNYDKDLFTELTLAAPNNMVENTTLNYGHSNSIDFTLTGSVKLFNYWNISHNLSATYDAVRGQAEGVNLDYNSWNYSFNLTNNFTLSQKYNWTAFLKYSFSSNSSGTAFNIRPYHSLDVSTMILLKGIYLTVGTYGSLVGNVKIDKTHSNFRFNRKLYRDRTWYVSLSYTFGNKKVKQVYGRGNNEVSRRMN